MNELRMVLPPRHRRRQFSMTIKETNPSHQLIFFVTFNLLITLHDISFGQDEKRIRNDSNKASFEKEQGRGLIDDGDDDHFNDSPPSSCSSIA